MSTLHCLTDYDVKLLLAFFESLKGQKKFSVFLIENGFPELAALSNAIQSDKEAFEWLLKNGYPEFAALSDAIDDEKGAIAWLEKYNCTFLSRFAAACRKDDEAIRWFAENDLKLFVMIIKEIHDILLNQAFDSSSVHKRRK